MTESMGRVSTVALAAAASALLVSLPMLMLLLSIPTTTDKYEQENHRMFMEWKAKYKKAYKHAGEEECRYALFKETRRHVAWSRAAGVASGSGLNGFAATDIAEMYRGYLGPGVRTREKKRESYEQETRRAFVGWKAKYGKSYRDVGEEECRFRLFMGNRRVVVRLNAAAAAGKDNVMYGLNQFGDLTKEEVRQGCYPEMEDRELNDRCQAAVLDPGPDRFHERLFWYQVCRCIATELKQTGLGGSAIRGDEAHV